MARPFLAPAALVVAAVSLYAGCNDPPKATPSETPTAVSAPDKTAPPASSLAAPPVAAQGPTRASCTYGPTVTFQQPGLEAEARKRLTKPDGPIAPSELRGIRSLDLSQSRVNWLDPCVLPLLTGLKSLYLGPGDLSDLSPIASLVGLENLRASINHVSDVHPIEKLTRLDRLDLGRTLVRDITPLAHLTNLTELQLDDTDVDDVSPLAACTKLERLSLKRTRVRDVSPLRNAHKLKFLYVEGTLAGDNFAALSPLTAKGLRVVR